MTNRRHALSGAERHVRVGIITFILSAGAFELMLPGQGCVYVGVAAGTLAMGLSATLDALDWVRAQMKGK